MISMLTGDAQAAGLGWLGSLLTTSFLTIFTAWALWAWAPWNRARMDAWARIPFDDGDR